MKPFGTTFEAKEQRSGTAGTEERPKREHPSEELLIRCMDGELEPGVEARVRAHLGSCRQCLDKEEEFLWTMRRFIELSSELFQLAPNAATSGADAPLEADCTKSR